MLFLIHKYVTLANYDWKKKETFGPKEKGTRKEIDLSGGEYFLFAEIRKEDKLFHY